jgi:hypothetical protein
MSMRGGEAGRVVRSRRRPRRSRTFRHDISSQSVRSRRLASNAWHSCPELSGLSGSGVPNYEIEIDTRYGLRAQAGVPKEIIPRLNAGIVNGLSKCEATEQLFRQGKVVQIISFAKCSKHVRAQVAEMRKIIKASGAKAKKCPNG